jgi:hypothetical protein
MSLTKDKKASGTSPFVSFILFVCLLIYYFLDASFLLCLVGVHCGIYKSSYNISNTSYLNSPPPHLPLPTFWNSFSWYHFFIYIHVYTVFALYSPSHALSQPPPTSQWTPAGRTYSALLFSDFVKEKQIDIFVCLR